MQKLAIVPIAHTSAEAGSLKDSSLPQDNLRDRQPGFVILRQLEDTILQKKDLSNLENQRQSANDIVHLDISARALTVVGCGYVLKGDLKNAGETLSSAAAKILESATDLNRLPQATDAAFQMGLQLCDNLSASQRSELQTKGQSPFAVMDELLPTLASSPEIHSLQAEGRPGSAFPRVQAACYRAMAAASLLRSGECEHALTELSLLKQTIETVNPNQDPSKEVDGRNIPIGLMAVGEFIRNVPKSEIEKLPADVPSKVYHLINDCRGSTISTSPDATAIDKQLKQYIS